MSPAWRGALELAVAPGTPLGRGLAEVRCTRIVSDPKVIGDKTIVALARVWSRGVEFRRVGIYRVHFGTDTHREQVYSRDYPRKLLVGYRGACADRKFGQSLEELETPQVINRPGVRSHSARARDDRKVTKPSILTASRHMAHRFAQGGSPTLSPSAVPVRERLGISERVMKCALSVGAQWGALSMFAAKYHGRSWCASRGGSISILASVTDGMRSRDPRASTISGDFFGELRRAEFRDCAERAMPALGDVPGEDYELCGLPDEKQSREAFDEGRSASHFKPKLPCHNGWEVRVASPYQIRHCG